MRRTTQARRGRWSVALILCAVLVAGCDPCAGTAQCAVDPYLAIDGQIVDAASSRGVDGVRIDVVRQGGVVVEQDSITTTTANDGHWRVQFRPASSGAVRVDVRVTAAGGAAYRVRGLSFATSERGGNASVLQRWVAVPYFTAAAELFVRGTTDERVIDTPVEFRRTSGQVLVGSSVWNGTYRGSSDFAGRVALFPFLGDVVASDGLGDVIGDLVVRPGSSDSSVARGIHIPASYLYRDAPVIIRLGVGPSINYQGELFSRATGARLGGVPVEFLRTGGVEVTTPSFTTTTQANGRFAMSTRPLTAGVLQGRLIIRSPAPARPETLLVSLPTFDNDSSRFFGVVPAGAYFPLFGLIITGSGVGLNGVRVDVTRVGGAAMLPESFSTLTVDGGIFRIAAVPLALGSSVVDITVTPPAPYAPFTIRSVNLPVFDRTVSDRSIGTYRLDAPPSAAVNANRAPL